MNAHDSQRMAEVLAPLGFTGADRPEDADVVILNTCHIREKAAEKVYSELGRLRRVKQARRESGGDLILAVAGCVAQAEGEEVFDRAPFVDIVFGPQTYHKLPDMVARATRASAKVLQTDLPVEEKFDCLPPARATGCTAFVTIQEGCDKFCSFCVVPYTRGAEFSRPAQDVLDEVRGLARAGVREITLLGQNVNNYHGFMLPERTEWSLGRLIREMATIAGIDRIRYTTSYPADVDEALISAHRDVPALMPFLHLPVQSGSDRILAAMNRRHTADDYRRLVDRLRAARPDLALASDFIVGFPGETDADFRQTLRLVEEIGFAQAYSFKYSPRPGTPAADLPRVEQRVSGERLLELQALLKAQQHRFNESVIGDVMPVLVSGRGRNVDQSVGRTPYMQAVHVSSSGADIGQIHDVRIVGAGPNSLSGEYAEIAAA